MLPGMPPLMPPSPPPLSISLMSEISASVVSIWPPGRGKSIRRVLDTLLPEARLERYCDSSAAPRAHGEELLP